MFGAPFPGSIAVRVAYLDHQEQGGAASTFTFSGVAFGAADAERYIVIGVTWVASPAKIVSSATIGGVSASVLVQAGTGSSAALIMASVPAGTSGSVVVNFSGAVGNVSVVAHSVFGTAGAVASSTASSSANNPSATLNIPEGGAAIAVAMASLNPAPSASWSGLTQSSQNTLGGSLTITGASGTFPAAAPSQTVTCSFSGTVGSIGCFAVFAPQ